MSALHYLVSRPGADAAAATSTPASCPTTCSRAPTATSSSRIGNDGQFRKFCEFAGHAALADDPRFKTNPQRLANRDDLRRRGRRHHEDEAAAILGRRAGRFRRAVLAGQTIDQVFEDPQVIAREMVAKMQHAKAGVELPVIASPIKMSETPPTYRRAPPVCGQHTDDVLRELLDMSAADVDALRARGVV